MLSVGGATVSYFEWVQNRTGLYWQEAEIDQRLEDIMKTQSDLVFDLAERKNIDIRTAAYLLGVQRIAGAITEKGTRDYFNETNPSK